LFLAIGTRIYLNECKIEMRIHQLKNDVKIPIC
jgi:hypothetical protein